MTRLSQRVDYATPDPKTLSLGSRGGGMGFVDVRLTPVSGPGQRTR